MIAFKKAQKTLDFNIFALAALWGLRGLRYGACYNPMPTKKKGVYLLAYAAEDIGSINQ